MIPDDNELNHYTRRKLLLSSDLAPPLGITAAELFRDTASTPLTKTDDDSSLYDDNDLNHYTRQLFMLPSDSAPLFRDTTSTPLTKTDDDSSVSDCRPNDDDGNDDETSLLTMKYYKDHCHNYDLIFHSDKLGFDISMVSPLPTGDEVFVKRVSSTAYKETIRPFDVLTSIHGISLPMILRLASSSSSGGKTSNNAKLEYIANFISKSKRPLTIRFARRNVTEDIPPSSKSPQIKALAENVHFKMPYSAFSVFETNEQNKPSAFRDISNVTNSMSQSAKYGCTMKSDMKKKLVTRKTVRETPPKSVIGSATKKLKCTTSTTSIVSATVTGKTMAIKLPESIQAKTMTTTPSCFISKSTPAATVAATTAVTILNNSELSNTVASKLRKCQGIRYGKQSRHYGTMNYFIGNYYRKVADKIETCDDFFSKIENKSNKSIPLGASLKSFVHDELYYKIKIEKGDTLIVYSTNCGTTTLSLKSTRCTACEGIESRISNLICRLVSLNDDEINISKHTTIKCIAQHPKTAEFMLRKYSKTNNLLKKVMKK